MGRRILDLGECQDYGTWTYLFTHDFMRLKGIFIMTITGQNEVNFHSTKTEYLASISKQTTEEAPSIAIMDKYVSSNDSINYEELVAEGKITDISHLAVSSENNVENINISAYDERKDDMEVVNNLYGGIYSYEMQPSQKHEFFSMDTTFLKVAAENYATLEDNQIFEHRNIFDSNFVNSTLDFFTGGKYTDEDIAIFQDQMTDVVFALAEQLKNGEEIDFSKVDTMMTIAGADVSFSQLMDFQTVGKELQSAFKNTSTSDSVSIAKHGTMGLAVAMSNYYGSDKGEIGQMFSNAMTSLYDEAMEELNQGLEWSIGNIYPPSPTYETLRRESFEISTGVADSFANIDTSSKESLTAGFEEVLKQARMSVADFESKWNAPYGTIVSDTAKLIEQFNSWMSLME